MNTVHWSLLGGWDRHRRSNWVKWSVSLHLHSLGSVSWAWRPSVAILKTWTGVRSKKTWRIVIFWHHACIRDYWEYSGFLTENVVWTLYNQWIWSCLPFLYTRTSLFWKYMMLLEYNSTLNVSSTSFMNICLFVYVGLLRCLRREFRCCNRMVYRFGITRILALKWYTAWQCK